MTQSVPPGFERFSQVTLVFKHLSLIGQLVNRWLGITQY
jgi:hypothetical protein